MNYQGQVTQWHDDKGYGFVHTNGQNERLFVHIKAFESSHLRPKVGDIIVFKKSKDRQGRLQATDIRYASKHRAKKQKPSPTRRHGARLCIHLCALAIIISVIASDIPIWLLAVFALMSVITALAYYRDKNKAQRGLWRTPESTLHLMSLLGGWYGAFWAQNAFNHKSRKPSFLFGFWCSVVANVGCVIWLTTEHGAEYVRLLNAFAI
ncbi:DUF1294 domain-containing protein [Pseudoalteromonas sp. SSDWG2]|uniref:DUF1294 domain-containing protein n=1 Tax=Pseudoalteromonas sp. SSDWG2 TaxID=3139391 RepID=UPI003BACF3C1